MNLTRRPLLPGPQEGDRFERREYREKKDIVTLYNHKCRKVSEGIKLCGAVQREQSGERKTRRDMCYQVAGSLDVLQAYGTKGPVRMRE